jgi:hypothetical protein
VLDSYANRRRRVTVAGRTQIAEGNRSDRDVHVYSICERTGDPRIVVLDISDATSACPERIRGSPTGTRIGRTNQSEARRKGYRLRRAGYHNPGILHRLSQSIEHVPRKLQHLIEEENAVMSQAHFAGAWNGATADQPRAGDGMMWCPKWPHSFVYLAL